VNILTSLLPGTRELRAPLAAGYLWIATFYLALNASDLDLSPAIRPLTPLIELIEPTGLLGAALIVTLGAYLVGTVTDGLWNLLVYPIVFNDLSFRGYRAIETFVSEKM
jgi:hypothetical protein